MIPDAHLGRKLIDRLLLLGSIHSDPQGFRRTSDFLNCRMPDLILVELSEYALAYRIEQGPYLRKLFLERLKGVSRSLGLEYRAALKNWRIAAILRQISLPYEYRASVAFSRKTGAPVVPVDYSDFSCEWVETWQEMISAENILHLLQLHDRPIPLSLQYRQAARKIKCAIPEPEFLSSKDCTKWRQREEHIASEILTALARFEPQRPVYIGGWRHLLTYGRVETIRNILGVELSACRLLGSEGFLNQSPPAVDSFPSNCFTF